jgi:large subunit ribosomal protein L25
MAQIALEATLRDSTGTGSARALRTAQRIPAVIYGEGEKPLHVSLPIKEVSLNCTKKAFKSTVIEITLNGKKILTLPREVQLNPVSDKPEHVDLQIISSKRPTKVFVPVKVTGQQKSPGVKRGGVLNIVRREIEFFCEPGKIPSEIEFDVSTLEIGRSVHINDIALPQGITAVIKRNFTLATIVGKGSDDEAGATADAATAAAASAASAAAGAPAAAGAAGAAGAKPAAGAAKPAAGAAKPAAKK